MWSDNETSEDLLGFKVHAELITEVIKDDLLLPITIGVFGDWGSGKSSILKITKEELDKLEDETFVLYFNGWLFEGYDDAKAALLESIVKAFEDNERFVPEVKIKARKLLKSVDWMRVLGLGFKNVALPIASAYSTGGTSLIPYLANKLGGLDSSIILEKLKGEDSENFLKSIIKDEEPEEKSMLVREFRDGFSELIRDSKIKKLVVIIDDLDRCTPERIIENLEAIKLFLNVEKTAFIIGADPRIVRHAIEYRYKTDRIELSDDPNSRNKRIVNDYLEKLIQVPYNLPRLSDNEVETYMTLLFCKKELGDDFQKVLSNFYTYREGNRYGTYGFGDLKNVINEAKYEKLRGSITLIASLSSIITEGLNGNPRQIKRFLNTFTLRNRLVKIAKINDFRIDILAKLMVLEYSVPGLFRKIYEWQVSQQGEPKELQELEELSEKSNIEILRTKYSADWATSKMLMWLKTEPKLSEVDLRDYFWISRDQLSGTISGASLIPAHIRLLFKKLITHGSGKILSNTINTEIKDKLSPVDLESLYTLLVKELSKHPEKTNVHKIFIEFMSLDVQESIEYYSRLIKNVDNSKIPFSIGNQIKLAIKNNSNVEIILNLFDKDSKIYKQLNQ
ncbi:KAP family P-loop NTPase fold protein [Wenyingzhuangia aestuarii]|uniref:KAP family P-loop NTPase fold protein n=1 Tax=Wenyingzhuangia aestuarii TaxID=1647582 RepID=UPI0014392B9E|nr:P-loop NTPase fold protein [Wenyingzhuangia aestuarii]NJB83592.1 hypothetical protein [Wenyingzhuangia aestuarii]